MMDINNFMRQLNTFKQTFSGNPQEQVQRLLNSGKVTQEQYNNAVNTANQIMRILGGKI